MPPLSELSTQQLQERKRQLIKQLEDYKSMGLKLDMSRGKPAPDQLDLSSGMLTCLSETDYLSENGTDCRNYGGLDGIMEMKRIFAGILGVEPEEVIVGGSSSLTMMFDNIASNMTHGVRDGEPWLAQGKVKFLCPSPGYDRHFAICEFFHIEMIPVAMTADGPDMDEVERLVSTDPQIKGMWCVPVFSNPTGIVYSDETVRRIASMKTAAPDFRLYWDNAYCIHNFKGERAKIPNILRECEKAGNPNMPIVFTSFSKVSFSGAGVSCMASSKSNCDYIRERLSVQTIGPDKLNQLRHIRFFGDVQGVYEHMKKHAQIIKPKFDAVLESLDKNLGGKGIAEWNKSVRGGYFISFDGPDGCAKKIVSLCKQTGVTLTSAGATYPYGKDPRDRNIRIAPSYPSLGELKQAIEIFCTAVELTAVEKMLGA